VVIGLNDCFLVDYGLDVLLRESVQVRVVLVEEGYVDVGCGYV
jgi:hypothetical protein